MSKKIRVILKLTDENVRYLLAHENATPDEVINDLIDEARAVNDEEKEELDQDALRTENEKLKRHLSIAENALAVKNDLLDTYREENKSLNKAMIHNCDNCAHYAKLIIEEPCNSCIGFDMWSIGEAHED